MSYDARTRLYRSNLAGQRLDDITVVTEQRGRITHNTDRQYTRDCEITIRDPDALELLRDFVIIETTLRDGAGAETVLSWGHFDLSAEDVRLDSAGRTATITGRDLTWTMDQQDYPAGIVVPAGVDTGAYARQVVADMGLAADRIAIPDSGVLTTAETVYDPGTTLYRVAADVLQTGGMYVPYAGGDGRIASRPYDDLTTFRPVVTYSTHDPAYLGIVEGSVRETPDHDRLRNRVVVLKVVPDAAPIVAVAEVTNAASPLHPVALQRDRGSQRPVYRSLTVPDPLVATVAEAQAKADAILAQRASVLRRVEIETLPTAGIDHDQIIGLDIRQGGQVRYAGTWWQRAWEARLDGPAVTIRRDLYRLEAWR